MDVQPLNAIVAFIQPQQLDRVVEALRLVPNFPGISVCEVRGFGHRGVHGSNAGERAGVDSFERKVRLEIYCRGSEVTSIIDTIREAARTGHPGDGNVFVTDLAWAVRIRNGEIGDAALLAGSKGDPGAESPALRDADERA